MSRPRVNILAILRDPEKRRWMMARVIVATQAREGIETTLDQALEAYDKVLEESRRDASFLLEKA